MRPGDVVLIRLPQTGGGPLKLRPALILSSLPGPYQNLLICGISTQVQRDWDELIQPSDPDFAQTGLRHASAVRLSYLYAADRTEISGTIGQVDPERLERFHCGWLAISIRSRSCVEARDSLQGAGPCRLQSQLEVCRTHWQKFKKSASFCSLAVKSALDGARQAPS